MVDDTLSTQHLDLLADDRIGVLHEHLDLLEEDVTALVLRRSCVDPFGP